MSPHLSRLRGNGLAWTWMLALLLGLAPAPHAWAAPAFSGSAALWGYVRDDSVDHVQLVPTLTLNVRELGHKAIRLETSVRGYTDIRSGQSEDRTLRILRALLIYQPQQSPWQVRLGQQWLNEGVGRDHVAGLWARYRFPGATSLTAFGGARVARVISLEDRYQEQGEAFGLNFRTHLDPFNVGVSWYYLQNDGNALYHAAGVDLNGRLTPWFFLRGRYEMNIEQSSVDRAQLLAELIARENVTVTAEFRSQTPRVYEDSFFTLFLSEASKEYARLGARWQFYREFYTRGTGMMVFADHDNALHKVQLALGHPLLEIGYTHWLSAYEATLSGFYAQGAYQLNDRWEIYGGYDFATGSNALADLRPEEESSSAYLGASLSPVEHFTVHGRAERIDDIRHTADWRALLSATVRFGNLR